VVLRRQAAGAAEVVLAVVEVLRPGRGPHQPWIATSSSSRALVGI